MDRLAFIPNVSAVEVEVPFLDLSTVNEPIRATVIEGLERLFDTNAFINGPDVEQFERAFAAFVGTDHCVGVASGLDALRLALIAIGVQPGDEVIVPASTFVATFEAVTQLGARPIVVDVSEADLCIDVDAAAEAITSRTRAIVPVHLYGQVADLRGLRELALERDVEIVEDAAQAHGASRDGIRAGCGGRAAAFSFYPAKNLGALGDAGAVTTDDAELAARVRALREHGQQAKYESIVEGYTARLDTVQAIALAAKLPALEAGNARRREIAAGYRARLDGVGDLRLPAVPSGSDPVWHLFVVRTANPTALAAALAAARVATGRHYPIPPHLSRAYASLGHREGDFPVTESLSRECLSLPIFPGMTDAQLDHVSATVSEYFGG